MNYDEQYVPILACVVERAMEYCQDANFLAEEKARAQSGHGEGLEYCQIVEECVQKEFAPAACRPEKCPFGPSGCDAVAWCLTQDTLQPYLDMYAELGDESGEEAAPAKQQDKEQQEEQMELGGEEMEEALRELFGMDA